ncbi:MAG: signal peptide peptidase SppA [Candidatus Binatia bacterium]
MERRHPILRAIGRLSATAFFVVVALAAYGWWSSEGFLLLSKDAVAIVTVQGVIEESTDIVRTLERFRDNEGIRAVVLRIDSPGGGVAPSQEIYDAVLRVKEKKPIVASLGGLAASGGYYVASACNAIVSNPGTLTGSIGVVMQTGNAVELMKRIGLEGVVVKAGKYKDIGSPIRQMTDEERALLESLLANVHEQFIDAVAKGRNLSAEEVRKVADGRIFSGQQAAELRLVDELGGLRNAVDLAAKQAGIVGEPRWIEYEKRQPPWWWRRVTSLLDTGSGRSGGLDFLYPGPAAG